MPPDEPARPVPVVLRIKLRYDDVETMVQKFAPNVGKAGLFLPTRSIQPIGTEVKFELRLSNETPVIVGLGKVKVARAPDPENPRATFGIGIELMRVTRESRDLILKLLERRRQLGLVEVPVPMPDDIDAARRTDVDTGAKSAATTAVPVAIPAAVSEGLLTSPRRSSGPIAVAKLADQVQRNREVVAITPLAPEPSRRHVRKPVGELIASVTGSIAADMFGGADEVDVKSVMARARTLAAGSDLDAELDALRESSAAPIVEISIEAASAELARQLGGKPVDRKNRNARWEVPPPSAPAPAATEIDPPPMDEDHVDDHADLAAGTKSAAAAVLAAFARPVVAPEVPVEPPPVVDESVPAAAPVPVEIEAKVVAPDEIDEIDEIHEIDDADVEELPAQPDAEEADDELAERAQFEREALAAHEVTHDPRAGYIRDDESHDRAADEAVAHASAEAMAAEAAEEDDPGDSFIPAGAEQLITEPQRDALPRNGRELLIDDDVDPSAFDAHDNTVTPLGDEFDLDSGYERTQFGVAPPQPEPEDFEHRAFQTDPAVHEAIADRLDVQLAAAEAAGDEDFGFGDPVEEIDDFEILAESDVDELVVADVGPSQRTHTSDDFVARLEFSSSSAATAAPDAYADDPLAGFRDSLPSYSDAAPADPLAGFSDEPSVEGDQRYAPGYAYGEPAYSQSPAWDPVTGSYTYANTPRESLEQDFDGSSTGHGGAQAFDESDVPTPPTHRAAQPRYLRTPVARPTEDSFDLENALEALDVDLDELAVPPEPLQRRNRTPTGGLRRTPAAALDVPTKRRDRVSRAKSEDDGILIDFDDDE